jgi:hypothetical protein
MMRRVRVNKTSTRATHLMTTQTQDCYAAKAYEDLEANIVPTVLKDRYGKFTTNTVSPIDMAAFKTCLDGAPFKASGTKENRRQQIEDQANAILARRRIGGIHAAHVNDSEPIGGIWQSTADGCFRIHPLIAVSGSEIAICQSNENGKTYWHQARVSVCPVTCADLMNRFNAFVALVGNETPNGRRGMVTPRTQPSKNSAATSRRDRKARPN